MSSAGSSCSCLCPVDLSHDTCSLNCTGTFFHLYSLHTLSFLGQCGFGLFHFLSLKDYTLLSLTFTVFCSVGLYWRLIKLPIGSCLCFLYLGIQSACFVLTGKLVVMSLFPFSSSWASLRTGKRWMVYGWICVWWGEMLLCAMANDSRGQVFFFVTSVGKKYYISDHEVFALLFFFLITMNGCFFFPFRVKTT